MKARMHSLSDAARLRLIRLYLILEGMEDDWSRTLFSSQQLGELLGCRSELLRKDLNTLNCRADGRGYLVETLRKDLGRKLFLKGVLKAGFSGLDSWGSLLLENGEELLGLKLAAGFDSRQNRLERTETTIPLFPTHEIADVFQKEEIPLGILASARVSPQRNLERMQEGGALGILNLTGRPLKVPGGIFYRQSDLRVSFMELVSRINGRE